MTTARRQQQDEDALAHLVFAVRAGDGSGRSRVSTVPKRAKCQKYGSLSVVGTTLYRYEA